MSAIIKEQFWLVTICLIIIAVVCLGIALQYAQEVLVPFVLAWFMYLMLSPILDFQVLKLKIPRPLAVILTVLIIILILAILFMVVTKAFQMIISTASSYDQTLIASIDKISEKLQGRWPTLQLEKITDTISQLIPGFLANTFGIAVRSVTEAMLVAIFILFLIMGRDPFRVRKGVYADIENQVRRYITMKTLTSLTAAVLFWLTLKILGLKLAGVFGILTFLLRFIPSIGAIIAIILPIPIAVAQFESPVPLILMIAILSFIEMIIGNIIEPKLFGQSLNLHPIVVLLALTFWGLLWGPIGMLLSVPITAVIRIVLLEIKPLRPIGMALAGQFSKEESASK